MQNTFRGIATISEAVLPNGSTRDRSVVARGTRSGTKDGTIPVEHFKSPFESSDFVVENRKFFDDMLDRAKRDRFFSYSFMSTGRVRP